MKGEENIFYHASQLRVAITFCEKNLKRWLYDLFLTNQRVTKTKYDILNFYLRSKLLYDSFYVRDCESCDSESSFWTIHFVYRVIRSFSLRRMKDWNLTTCITFPTFHVFFPLRIGLSSYVQDFQHAERGVVVVHAHLRYAVTWLGHAKVGNLI